MSIILAAAGLLALLHVLPLLPAVGRRFPAFRSAALSCLLATGSLLLGLAGLEAYFAFVHDQSDGFNLTHAGRTWFARHWKPVNSLGYRDAEPSPPAPGQPSVAVLGDSFAAGHGIENPDDRLGEVAAARLGPGWRLYTVAHIGWDTVDQTKALAAYPVKPRYVALVYTLNDIFHAASEAKYPLNFSVNLPSGALKALLERSALADYVYWRLSRGGNLSGGGQSFWKSLQGAYADPEVWRIHRAELGQMVDWCAANGAVPVALVFPMLQNPAESAPLTAKVTQALEAMGVTAVDLAPVFSGRPPGDLVVNSLDAHPNRAVHREVGELLAKLLTQAAARPGG